MCPLNLQFIGGEIKGDTEFSCLCIFYYILFFIYIFFIFFNFFFNFFIFYIIGPPALPE